MVNVVDDVYTDIAEKPPTVGAVDCQVEPFDVSKLPDVPGATNNGADVPLPRITLLAVSVVVPVPPLAIGSVPVTPVLRGTLVIVLFEPLIVLLVNV
jgi:hypothetical protein